MPTPFKPKSIIIYRVTSDLDLSSFAEKLSTLKFQPCAPQDMSRTGWVSPLGDEYEDLLHEGNGLVLLNAKNETKILPPATIKEIVSERVIKLETEQLRRLKKTEIASLKDVVLAELLPKALSKYSRTAVWIDTRSRLLVVDTSSARKAEEVLALLRKTIGSVPVIPFTLEHPIELTLTKWVRSGELPPGFALADEATLKAVLEDGGVVTSKKQDLVCDEIASHIEAGKLVTKLTIAWQEQITFCIDDSFILSRIHFDEVLLEENDDIDHDDFAQRFDADFILFTGVIMEIIDLLIQELGGEAKRKIETQPNSNNQAEDSNEGES